MYPPLVFYFDKVGNLPIEPARMQEYTNGFPLIVGHLGNGYHFSIKEYLTAVV